MYRTDFWTLWEKASVGCFERTASNHVYYLGWNRSPAQVGCMRQVLRPGALGRPRGIRWRGRWEGESGWGTHVNPWLIHVNVWQNPLQYFKVINLQLIKINEKKNSFMVNRQFVERQYLENSQNELKNSAVDLCGVICLIAYFRMGLRAKASNWYRDTPVFMPGETAYVLNFSVNWNPLFFHLVQGDMLWFYKGLREDFFPSLTWTV